METIKKQLGTPDGEESKLLPTYSLGSPSFKKVSLFQPTNPVTLKVDGENRLEQTQSVTTSFAQPKVNFEKSKPEFYGLDNEKAVGTEEGQLLKDGQNRRSVSQQEEKPENSLDL